MRRRIRQRKSLSTRGRRRRTFVAELALLVALTVALYFLVVSGLGGELGRAFGAVVQVPTFA